MFLFVLNAYVNLLIVSFFPTTLPNVNLVLGDTRQYLTWNVILYTRGGQSAAL